MQYDTDFNRHAGFHLYGELGRGNDPTVCCTHYLVITSCNEIVSNTVLAVTVKYVVKVLEEDVSV
jgi:hypothetical protein